MLMTVTPILLDLLFFWQTFEEEYPKREEDCM